MSTDNAKPLTVRTPEIGGVTLRRHLLDREAAGLAKLAQRLGKRLRLWLKRMPDVEAKRVVGRDPETGVNLEEPITGADGQPVIVPWIPDSDWRDNYDLYTKVVVALLKEQRERAKLVPKNGATPVSDEVFEAQLKELAIKALDEMPRSELEKLLAERLK